MSDKVNATVHHFYPSPATGFACLDEDGDPMIGYYWLLSDGDDVAITEYMGPYHSLEEALAACHHAYETGDF